MNDDELRSLIRVAIQKHMTSGESASSDSARAPLGELRRDPASGGGSVVSISFGQYQLERAKDDTMCLIEPAVQCNHCGYCKCHGH
jgi:hypothetical protein